jgi:hypothetical protein
MVAIVVLLSWLKALVCLDLGMIVLAERRMH